jgi:hypothetical protein
MEFIPWLVAVYVVICVAAYFGNRLFMYLPDPTRVVPAEASLDGGRHTGCVTPAKDNKPTILSFHGNGANAAARASKVETMRYNGFCVFYLNNRGYGGSGERPTEKDNVADAIAAYDYLIGLEVPAGRIVCLRRVARLARRCGWQRKDQLPQSCWKRRLPRQSMWQGPPIFGCRSACSLPTNTTTNATSAPSRLRFSFCTASRMR